MRAIPLYRLHARRIRVEMEINRQTHSFHGTGAYQFWPDSGWILRIAIADTTGDFSIILRESEWQGEIKCCPSANCDYHIWINQQESYARPAING